MSSPDTATPGALGGIQLGLAAAAVFLSLWAAAHITVFLTIPAVAAGAAIGNWAGARTARALARQFTLTRRIVLYSEDTPLYAVLLPLASAIMSPLVFVWMAFSILSSPVLQTVVPIVLCFMTVSWLSHDLSLARNVWLLSERLGNVPIQWFHARSVVGPEGMLGQRGTVIAACEPLGHVLIAGERWRARSWDGSPLPAGQRVEVQHVLGLMLVVAPAVSDDAES